MRLDNLSLRVVDEDDVVQHVAELSWLVELLRRAREGFNQLETRRELPAPEVRVVEVLAAAGAPFECLEMLGLRVIEDGSVGFGRVPDLDVGFDAVADVAEDEPGALLTVVLNRDTEVAVI